MAKKVLVWNKEYGDKAIGQIERIDTIEAIDSWTHCLKGLMDEVDCPVELEDKTVFELEAVQVDGEWVIQEKIVE